MNKITRTEKDKQACTEPLILDNYKQQLAEHQENIRKLEAQMRNIAPTYIVCTLENIKKLIKEGHIPQKLGKWYLNWIDKQNTTFREWYKFINDNPHLHDKDKITRFYGLPKTLSVKELLKKYEEITNLGKIHNLMWAIEQTKEIAQDAIPVTFFNNVEKDEYGISRLFADPLKHISKILEKFTDPEAINEGSYITQAKCDNSYGDQIKLEYRYRASSMEEAIKQKQEFIERIKGRQLKVFQACCALANERKSRVITCDLTEIMTIAYPDRKNNESFSVGQRLEFFQDLLDLSGTQLTLTKKSQSSRKKDQISSFLLPFLTIYKTSGYDIASRKKSVRYPNNISFSVMHNPMYEREKMYNVGAGFKRRTLELRPEDMQFAYSIQVRKHQLMNAKYITYTDRDTLLKEAGIAGIKHSGMANKRLLDRCDRLKEKGIILSYPSRVSLPFNIKIR